MNPVTFIGCKPPQVNIVMKSDSMAIVNGNEIYIDTIYGDPTVIGDEGYYIYVEDADGNSDFGNTYYTFEGAQRVFKEYLERVRSKGFIAFRDFETERINSLPF